MLSLLGKSGLLEGISYWAPLSPGPEKLPHLGYPAFLLHKSGRREVSALATSPLKAVFVVSSLWLLTVLLVHKRFFFWGGGVAKNLKLNVFTIKFSVFDFVLAV